MKKVTYICCCVAYDFDCIVIKICNSHRCKSTNSNSEIHAEDLENESHKSVDESKCFENTRIQLCLLNVRHAHKRLQSTSL